jgi:hypothetical protein
MESFYAYCFIIAGMLAVDVCARFSLESTRSAGLVSLLLCFFNSIGKGAYPKPLATKRFILSLLLIIFLLFTSALLLENGIPEEAGLIDFALFLSPLFILPFYHFLYELLGVGSLSVPGLLINFRLRGSLALLLGANVIFISLNPLNRLISLLGHFTLGYLAILGMFYLCSLARKKVSVFDPPINDNDQAIEPVILRYGISVLEIFYCLSLLFFTFLSGLGQILEITNHWLFAATTLALLLITTMINKMHGLSTQWLLSFYENKAVPLSFIFFGIINLLDAYF